MRLRNPSDEAWQRIKKQLMTGAWKVSPDGRWWLQDGLERTFLKQKEFAEEQRRKANKKWEKEDAGTLPDASRFDAGSMPEPMPKVCSSSSSASSNPKPYPQTPSADDQCETSTSKNSKPTETQVEKLYSLYPRLRDKLDAKKAIRKAVAVVMAGDADHAAMSVDDALDYLAQRIAHYARCVQGCDRDFIPYPASWFNAGSFWDDERDWSKQPSKTNGNGYSSRSTPAITGSAVENTVALLEGGMQ